ncbi:recombinase family protein [Kitasatospora sp. NPDC017646]|uniref:recombinase family protein n=1 Tax=Kitasatospora sp. NPDC017646 TaxID=3364024 RepID=UPI00378A9345
MPPNTSCTPTRDFQVVAYLAKTNSYFPERELSACEAYAHAFNWNISLIVVDDEVDMKGPQHRPMLQAALRQIRDSQAGAILVPTKATISPIDGEFNEFAERVEKASGFIQIATRR